MLTRDQTSSAAPQKTNLRKLAEIIHDTGRSAEILAALEVVLSAGLADKLRTDPQEGGADA